MTSLVLLASDDKLARGLEPDQLGMVALQHFDYDTAQARFEEAHQLYQQTGTSSATPAASIASVRSPGTLQLRNCTGPLLVLQP
jgi:hypothetical protein